MGNGSSQFFSESTCNNSSLPAQPTFQDVISDSFYCSLLQPFSNLSSHNQQWERVSRHCLWISFSVHIFQRSSTISFYCQSLGCFWDKCCLLLLRHFFICCWYVYQYPVR